MATQVFAQKRGKPHLLVTMDAGVTDEIVANVLAWLHDHAIATVNVAGPRESKRSGIYEQTFNLLVAIDAAGRRGPDKP